MGTQGPEAEPAAEEKQEAKHQHQAVSHCKPHFLQEEKEINI